MKSGADQAAAGTKPAKTGPDICWLHLAALLVVWGLFIWLVNPLGEYTSNDGPSFVQSMRALVNQGRLIETGYPTGGPSLIVHLLCAWPFVAALGDTVTAMHLSVLFWGVLGSVGMLVLLRRLGLPCRQSLLGALVLGLNPLYFSLAFSFMTEVTFCVFVIFSVAAFFEGRHRHSQSWIIAGLLLSLAATLIRQFGAVIPMALMASALLSKRPLPFGRAHLALLICGLFVAPWMAWEAVLSVSAGTTVFNHRLAGNIWAQFVSKPLADYVSFLLFRLFVVIPLYCSVFTAPVWLWKGASYWRITRVRQGLAVYAALFVLWEGAILAGLISPPVAFYRNVIINFGLGPLLFKDTYILGMAALAPLHPALYYGLVFLGIPGAVIILHRILGFLRGLFSPRGAANGRWDIALVYLATIIYSGVILLTGFHDRYFIPLVALMTIWLAADSKNPGDGGQDDPARIALKAAATACLLGLGAFSLTATHDFVATRKAAHKAQQFVLHQMKIPPCHFDGGYEYNGYHCRKLVKKSGDRMSWWWVEREDALLSMHKLPGYKVAAAFPIKRWLGRDGALFVLKPR